MKSKIRHACLLAKRCNYSLSRYLGRLKAHNAATSPDGKPPGFRPM
ncbi:MAG: hypothetical protein AB1894_17605 [Chloroflexota bacterium]